MQANYISLAKLLENSQIYERLPQPIQGALRKSVWYSLAAQVFSLVIANIVPIYWLQRPINGRFFLFGKDWVNAILEFTYAAYPYLILINLGCLFLTILILTCSFCMIQPQHEPIHWLAFVNIIPTSISIVLIAIISFLILMILLLLVVAWLVLAIIAMFCFVALLIGAFKLIKVIYARVQG